MTHNHPASAEQQERTVTALTVLNGGLFDIQEISSSETEIKLEKPSQNFPANHCVRRVFQGHRYMFKTDTRVTVWLQIGIVKID